MRISFLPAQLRQGIAKQTSMPNDPDVVPSQPGSEIIVAPIINEVWDERGKFSRRVHRHHEHLCILPKGGRILSESKKPKHRQTRPGFSSELKSPGYLRKPTSSQVPGSSLRDQFAVSKFHQPRRVITHSTKRQFQICFFITNPI